MQLEEEWWNRLPSRRADSSNPSWAESFSKEDGRTSRAGAENGLAGNTGDARTICSSGVDEPFGDAIASTPKARGSFASRFSERGVARDAEGERPSSPLRRLLVGLGGYVVPPIALIAFVLCMRAAFLLPIGVPVQVK